jgi:hypothetical protein
MFRLALHDLAFAGALAPAGEIVSSEQSQAYLKLR